MTPPRQPNIRIGSQLIDIVTSGMYNNPLMALREYVQNSVDAIEVAERDGILPKDTGAIDITLDGAHRQIVIEDNGIGMTLSKAAELLSGLGLSSKQTGTARGFRGIGRLGGLGYAEELMFETRASGQSFVSIISWNPAQLQAFLRKHRGQSDLTAAISAAVTIQRRKARQDEQPHFFRVSLRGIRRFHRDDLMNLGRVKAYLQQVVPIPFDTTRFSFAKQISRHLSGLHGYRSVTVRLNGRVLHRPHTSVFGRVHQPEEIHGIQLFSIAGPGDTEIGRGWFANTACTAALPPSVAMRGIRVRQGNIEIGDEYFFADLYSEHRFSTWHIGEVHVNYHLRANARRDGFEESEDCEALWEYGAQLCRHLSQQCRRSSQQRSTAAKVEKALAQTEHALHTNFFLNEEYGAEQQSFFEQELQRITDLAKKTSQAHSYEKRLKAVKRKIGTLKRGQDTFIERLDGQQLRTYNKRSLLQVVASAILEHHDDPLQAEALVRKVMAPFEKSR